MPNHVTNVITSTPEVIDAITRPYTPEEIAQIDQDYARTQVNYKERTGNDWPYPKDDTSGRIVDFALVVPEPANMFHGGCNGHHPHVDENGVVLACWYTWNVDNWGTKWNAYDYSVTPQPGDLCEARFDTAWSHPMPVIAALSLKFPDEEIVVKFADEDFGSNCGRYKIRNGQTYDEFFPEYGEESQRLAAEVKYPGKTLEELKAEWDQDEIEHAQQAAFVKQIEAERGVDNGYQVIRDENLTVPEEIKQRIQTKGQAEAFWETASA